MEISLTQQALLYLLNCAVNDRVMEELPPEVDFEELYKLSKSHSVAAMVSYALDKGGYLKTECMTQELIQKWASARIGAIRKNLMFDAERKEIFRHLEEIGCWYMPLKGVVLKEMYPDVGMREMADNDILFDESFRENLKEYMVERGYEVEMYGNYVHDSYMKSSFYNFEMHVVLFRYDTRNNWFKYYENIKDSLCKDTQNKFGYHFTDEDFYIYITAHTYSHYKGGGTGIRSFLDAYVYLKNKKCVLDWKYIISETSYIKIDKFESESRKFVQRLFCAENIFQDMQPQSEKEAKMLSYILGSGTYGTLSNKVENDISRIVEADETRFSTKLKYCIQRMFPGIDYMRMNYPFLYKYKQLIPFFWIYRLIVLPIVHRKRICAEIRTLVKIK